MPSINECGYAISKRGSKINVKPTINFPDCNLTIGLGDATFTINPKFPPSTLSVFINGDSNSEIIVHEVAYSIKRKVKSYETKSTQTEVFVDANGVQTEITVPKLNGFLLTLGATVQNGGVCASGTVNSNTTSKINW